jgi:hypothetical protein
MLISSILGIGETYVCAINYYKYMKCNSWLKNEKD